MALSYVLGITILALLAAVYSVLAWKAGARFGHRILLLTWPAASLLLLVYCYLTVVRTATGFFTADMYITAVFAIFLAFGLTTRSIWRGLTRLDYSRHVTISAVVRAAGAFFLGLVLGVVPLLVLDIFRLVRG